MTLAGGCFCGKVRYEVAGEVFNASLCHCTTCRRTTGAPVTAWFSTPTPAFRFVSGSPREIVSSPTGVRRFCGDCGTLLTFVDSRYDDVDVTLASLDDPAQVTPVDQLWVGSRLAWMQTAPALPELPQGHNAPPPSA